MTGNHRRVAALLLGGTLIAGHIQPAVASSSSLIQSRSIDLTRYYPSRDVAHAALDALAKDADSLPVTVTAGDLYPYIHRADEQIAQAQRASAYFGMLVAENYDDRAADTTGDRADAIRDQIMLKVRSALRALPPRTLDAMATRDPRLRRYAYLGAQIAEAARHDLSPDAARIFDAIDDPATSTLWTVYQRLNRITVAGTTKTDPQAAASPNRSIREAAWRNKWKSRTIKADANAALLLGTVKLGEKEARLRHYTDAVSAGYAHRELTRDGVSRTLASVQANLDLYRAYQKLRAREITAQTGITDPRPWDMALLNGNAKAHFSFADAQRIVPAALAPLGKDYVSHFSAMLAPSSGRVDYAQTIGKRESGGFSIQAPGVPTGLYMAVFNGSLDDMRVVIHEGGHAIAGQFANEGDTPAFFVQGPNWLMESYALLNEFLLYDYLARTSRSAADRRAYTEALVNDMMFQVFGSAEEATLEQNIYDAAETGKLQSASDLDAVCFRVMRSFEPWPDDVLRSSSTRWSAERLLFQDPFYYINYLYAGIIAIDLYAEAKAHPETFPERYETLLRRGYDAPPMTLLAPLLGKNQNSDALEKSAFGVIREKMIALNALSQTG